MFSKLLFVPLFFIAFTSLKGQEVTREWVAEMALNTIHNKLAKNMSALMEMDELPQEIQQELEENILQPFGFREEDKQVSDTPDTESEIHAAINPTDTNNIIVAAMKFGEGVLGPSLTFPIYYSQDFGQSWELSDFDGVSDLPAGSFVAGGGDPIIVFDSEGKAYLSWLTFTVDLSFEFTLALHLAVSEDGGATWERQEGTIDQGVVTDLLNPQGRFVDKEWMAVDRSDSEFKDQVYIAYAEIDLSDTTYNILVQRKTPNSLSFSGNAVDITPENMIFSQFSSIDVDEEGNVHVMYTGGREGDTAFGLFHSISEDGGQTFSAPVKISNFSLPCFPPGSGQSCDIVGIDSARVYPCAHLRVDVGESPHQGNLYAVWTANGQNQPESNGMDIYFSRSFDKGQSWTPATILNNDSDPNTQQFFPSIAVNDEGTLVITWYDRREDPNNEMTKYYMTLSRDGGESFESDFPVSSESSNFSVIGQANGNFGVGEYTQVITSPSFAIPFWADGRSNDGNIEIYSSYIQIASQEVTGIDELKTLSTKFSVEGPYPNPIQSELTLEIDLKENSQITIELLSAEGKPVASIESSNFSKGKHRFQWNAKHLPAGNYFCVVKTDFGYWTKGVQKG